MIPLLCLVGLAFALLHFVFESVIAPSIRFSIRFELFALRDRLRALKLSRPELSDEAFDTVQDALNGAIKMIYDIDLVALFQCDSLVRRDPVLRSRVRKRKAIVDSVGLEELQDIVRSLRRKVERAAVVNNGGWMLYVIPLLMTMVALKWICSPLTSILYLPQSEIRKVMAWPDQETALA